MWWKNNIVLPVLYHFFSVWKSGGKKHEWWQDKRLLSIEQNALNSSHTFFPTECIITFEASNFFLVDDPHRDHNIHNIQYTVHKIYNVELKM